MHFKQNKKIEVKKIKNVKIMTISLLLKRKTIHALEN